jgi:hypothetical protein
MAMTECAWCLGALNKDAEGMWGGCTRDDIIRLVVGMQWREAMLHTTVDAFGWVKETRIRPWSDTRPASDIVDEWLGAP